MIAAWILTAWSAAAAPQNCIDGICFTDRGTSGEIDLGTVNGGVSVIDYDNDGYPDLFVGDDAGKSNRLYRNAPDATSPGARTFVDVTAGSGLDDLDNTGREAYGIVVADYDNDGWSDVYVTGNKSDGTAGVLYHNEGGGRFTNASVASGVRVSGFRPLSASWNDYDLDGFVDLMLCKAAGSAAPLLLLHNEGDGTFSDASDLLPSVSPFFLAYSQLWMDYDQDGYSDCFVLVESGPSILLKNVDDGSGGREFVNVASSVGFTGLGSFPMGIAAGDFDGDGDLDIGLSNASAGAYFENEGTSVKKVFPFTSIWGWGVSWLDVENDGDLDYYMAASWPTSKFDKLFRNLGGGAFDDVSTALNGPSRPSRFSVQIDFDNDGKQDVVTVNPSGSGPVSVYHNISTGTGHWSKVSLTGGFGSNALAIGAVVNLTAGGTTQVRAILSGSSTSSTEDLRAHFGLGATTSIDEIEVIWPRAGCVEARTEVYAGPFPVDRIIELSPRGATAYCTAKVNSCGRAPSMSALGSPSASASSGFVVRASNAKAGKPGLLLYTDAGRASIPFDGGLLCLHPQPLARSTPVADTSGTPPLCNGVLSIDMNAFAAGALGGTPLPSLLLPGTRINCQFWARDTIGNSLLSDALEYSICP